jgi:hypothetical protein
LVNELPRFVRDLNGQYRPQPKRVRLTGAWIQTAIRMKKARVERREAKPLASP